MPTGRRPDESAALLRYEYHSLNSPGSIRLLKLTRQFILRSRESYRATLKEYRLNSCPPFTALSYVWGDPRDIVDIPCDGKPISVTRNCSSALQALARRRFPRQYVWIDAVCINQADDREKSGQVALMSDIYTTAAHVMVWLGNGDDATRDGMKRLRRCAWMHRLALWEGLPLRKWRRQTYMRYIEDGFRARNEGDDRTLPSGSIGEVLSNEWFERLWTLQEAALPSSDQVSLCCGTRRVRFDRVMDLADFAMAKDPRIDHYIFPQAMVYCSALSTIHYAKLGDRGPEDSPFRLLIVSNQKHTSHAVDHVFATYGLAVRNGLQPPRPDYGKSIVDVYTEMARYCIESEGKLGVLTMVGGRPLPSLPSWVPNLSIADYPSAGGEYHACGSSKSVFAFDDSGRRLKVKGIVLETIEAVGPAIPLRKGVMTPRMYSLKSTFLEAFKTAIPAWLQLVKENRTVKTTEAERIDLLNWTMDLEERPSDDESPGVDVVQLVWLLANMSSLPPEDEAQLDFLISMLAVRLSGRRFFLTSFGRVGLGPERCEAGDPVAIISGPRLPFIVRPKDSDFELVGWAFVHGIMAGQAWLGDASLLQDITFV